MTAQKPFDLAPGDVLEGRYRLDELLGEGGFGAVYRATQLNLDRQVAIKVVLPHLLATPELLERFLREAQVAQRLEHPNTVRMYDFGHTDSGVPYIAWELLKGRPLDEVLKQEGPLSMDRVVRVTSQVLKALMEAHSQGIIHRDIKPANIFLSDFQGEPDFVKVLDFGIAKALDTTEGQGSKNLTMAGQIIGTPNYMAPEQVEGREVGPTVDLYALGLVMAEMLTGQPVLQGSGLAVCAAHLSPEPLPIHPQVLSSPLGPVIARATQKQVSQRHLTAQQMLQELREVARIGGLDSGIFQGDPSSGGFGRVPSAGAGSPPSSGAAWDATTPPPSSLLTPMPTVGPIPTSGGTSRLLLILVGVLGTLVIVGGLIIGILAFVIADDDPGFPEPVTTTTSPQVGPQITQPLGSTGPRIPEGVVGQPVQGNLALLTTDLISQRIQAAGYSLLQAPLEQNSGVVRTAVVSAMSGQSTVTVMFYDYDMPMAIPALVAGFRQQPGAVHSDDRRVLYVRCMGSSPQGLDQQILSYLLR